MASTRQPKKRVNNKEDEKDFTRPADEIISLTRSTSKNLENKNVFDLFFQWKFGTVNIRTGQEKSGGAKLYMITKEVARAKLEFCCLQEVRYRNTGKKIIKLDTG